MPAPQPDRPILWRSRPLLSAAAMVALGIATSHQVDLEPLIWSGLVLVSVAVAAGLALVPRRRLVTLRPLTITCCAGLALFALGGQRYAVWATGTAAPLSVVAEEVDTYEHAIPLLVSGRVMGSATQTERRLSFRLLVDSVGFDQLTQTSGRAEVTLWRPLEFGEVDATSPLPPWPDLQPGHQVRVEGMLRPLPRRRNPADFDYGEYLRRRGIHAVVSGSDVSALEIVSYSPSISERSLSAARGHVRAALEAHIRDEDSRSILQALLLADRSGIDREVRQGFARTGLAHLLAVSGLHVFLVGMVLYNLLKPLFHRLGWTWRRVEVSRAVITVAILGMYVSVVGGPASAVRALVMATAFIGGRAFERPSNALNSLGAAGLVLLMARPAALMDAGFQLSFAAVGALILLIPSLERMVPSRILEWSIPKYFIQLVLASVAATLGTMPVLLAHFGVLPTAGLILNVVAIPATALALGSGILAVIFHGWFAPLAAAAGAAGDVFARFVLNTGLYGERWLGWTAIGMHITDLLVLIALTLTVLIISLWNRPRLRWRTASVACCCLGVALWLPIIGGEHRQKLDIMFFDVGQGDAALISLPNGRSLLVDAGPRDPYGDAGSRTIIPHLERFGIRRLDAIVVSHPHSDHLGGVPALIRSIPVDTLYDNGDTFDSDLYHETVSVAAEAGVPVRGLASGDELNLDPNVAIRVLHPGPEPDEHANDASVVLLVKYGEVKFLFSGDVEVAAEATLVGRFGNLLCADLVKVPHHGSRTSSTAPLVEMASRCSTLQFAVVPVARRNRYNLPNEDALQRWRVTGAQTLLTAEEGALTFRSNGKRVWRRAWR